MNEDLIIQISHLIDEIKPYLKRAKINVPKIAFKGTKLRGADTEALTNAIHWLTIYRKRTCGELDNAIATCTPLFLTLMDACGTKNSEEQVRIKDAYIQIREQWRKRPDILTRKPSPKKEVIVAKRTKSKRSNNSGQGQRPQNSKQQLRSQFIA